jgi:pyruvate,orthophosphate dikinase
LLVSVRSGAKFSMPGMMDTVLNLGLNAESVKGLTEQTGGDLRFARDAYRRFIQMFGKIVMNVPADAFEHALDEGSRRTRANSSACRSRPSSSRGTASAPATTAARTRSATTWAPP